MSLDLNPLRTVSLICKLKHFTRPCNIQKYVYFNSETNLPKY